MTSRARAYILVAMAGAMLAAGGRTPATPSSGFQLTTAPAIVYKNADSGRANTESWFFCLVVDGAGGRDLQPVQARIDVLAGTVVRETTIIPRSTIESMKMKSFQVTPDMDSLNVQRMAARDEAFDLRLRFAAKPAAWRADRVRIALTLSSPGQKDFVATLDVPLSVYVQKTSLIFPIKGPAIVTQGQINNFGHAGYANQFAIDVMGLNKEYGPMTDVTQGNGQFAGFGEEIVAPANGKVVYVRNDVPDNPPDTDPVTVYSKVREPLLATAGNCVVIDHGNGEFSALMHMQQGSVTVSVGSEVQPGQMIGRLGCSGDAFMPHLHFQLQDGPELFKAVSLPVKFDNLSGVDLARGVYLTPH